MTSFLKLPLFLGVLCCISSPTVATGEKKCKQISIWILMGCICVAYICFVFVMHLYPICIQYWKKCDRWLYFQRGMCPTSQRTGEMIREQKDFQQIARSTQNVSSCVRWGNIFLISWFFVVVKFILFLESLLSGFYRQLYSFLNSQVFIEI